MLEPRTRGAKTSPTIRRPVSPPSATAKQVYRAAADAFGGEPKVDRRYDEDESHSVDVLRCADRPVPGLAVYSTLTLHDTPNHLDDSDIRVELMGVAPGDVEDYPDLLATAAFCIIKDGWLAAPGVVFPDLLRMYELSPTLRHLMWAAPFPYEQLSTVEVRNAPDVHWLLGVPISEQERLFLLEHGYDALERRFVDAGLDYWRLDRESVVEGAT